MKRLFKKRKTIAAMSLAIAIVLVPYLWSRICSPGNRIQVFADATLNTPTQDSLKVACYNIAHGRGLAESNWDGGDSATRIARLDQIAELLVELDADVVVLNEVDFDTSWSHHVNQAEYLADKAGYPFRVEERNLDFRVLHRTWRFGNAILSRYPISNAEVIDLPSYATVETWLAGKKRGVRCDVKVGHKSFRIVGLHLSHRSEAVRELSARAVVNLVRESALPCVVMGDMNSTPPGFPGSSQTAAGENAIKTFDHSDLLKRNDPAIPLGEQEMTFRADRPNLIIDWVLISGNLAFESYSAKESVLSDHRPVVAVLSLGAQGN